MDLPELVDTALTHPLAPVTRMTYWAKHRIVRHALCMLAVSRSPCIPLGDYHHATPDDFERERCAQCGEAVTWTR